VGDDHAVRLPRSDAYAVDLRTEARWLPRLSPLLDTPVPDVTFVAEPSDLFPRPWTLVTWLPGENPNELEPAEQLRLARGLGRFMRNLHDLDTFGLEAGAQQWGYRAGEPVNDSIDAWLEDAARQLAGLFDPSQVRKAWRRLREVPAASEPPCWVHTDLSTENLLVAPGGQLVGVVDFGGLGIGDRSVDLLYAWSMFDQPAREVLRTEACADEATWRRARAWAFVGPGLSTICSYRDSMPARTRTLIRMVEAVSEEVGVPLR
jgi:aminoglycoside phosphotransferase (APT) family kinase protein